MIPIRDNQISDCVPVVTYGLMAINCLAWLFQIQAGLVSDTFYYLYGLVPAKYTVQEMSRHFSIFNQVFSVFPICFSMGDSGTSWEICGPCIFSGTMWKPISDRSGFWGFMCCAA